MEHLLIVLAIGAKLKALLSGLGAIGAVGAVVTILRKKGYISTVKIFSKRAAQITKEVGEFLLDTSTVFNKVDEAIRDDGTLIENSVKDVIAAGKEAIAEFEDVIVVIKPKKKK